MLEDPELRHTLSESRGREPVVGQVASLHRPPEESTMRCERDAGEERLAPISADLLREYVPTPT
jgi:hypothetical protein